MKVQRVEMFVSPMATPADTSGLQKLATSGKIKPDTLVALVGKTEGTGFHDDWGRVWADVALRDWTGKFLGIPADEVAKHVIFVLSGGCPGVITPHIAAVTREWVEVPDKEAAGGEKRLVVGRGGSEPVPPEEVGRMGQIRKVAAATHEAMKDAGLTDPKDVHLVMVKVPGLTTASIKDAESRGQTVVSHDLTFGPEGAGVYANDAAALGVAMALGEVAESALSDSVVRRNWDLYSSVAMTSSGGEKRHGEVVLFGNSANSRSHLTIGHAITRDFIDAEGVRHALRSAGLRFKDGLPDEADLGRLVHVFAKSVIPGSDQIRGQRITLLDDADAYQIGKALGGMIVASVTGRTTNYVSGGERNSHQGPPGGNIVAAVVRAED